MWYNGNRKQAERFCSHRTDVILYGKYSRILCVYIFRTAVFMRSIFLIYGIESAIEYKKYNPVRSGGHRFHFKEGFTIAIKELQINEEIRDKEIRVISANGEQLGVMSPAKAAEIAYEKNLDLVKIAPQAQPPVCKIMDYGKYKFELAKREKENRKNQKTMNIKEVQLSPSIDTNDFNTKCKNAVKFLKNGDKVKVTVRFRGREVSHSEIGEALLIRFAETAKEAGNMEHPPKLEGRNMTMFLVPVTQ